MKQYDIAIIGSGPGGYTAALKASKKSKNICLIEKSHETVGGVCLNEGCIPTKSIINSSNILETIKNGGEYGIEVDIKNIDMSKIVDCSRKCVEKLKQGLLYLFKMNNIDLIYGSGKIVDKNNISVKKENGHKEVIEAENIIIATGSKPKLIPGVEPDGRKILTSSQIIKLDYIPKRLLIIGGGAIGVEFASIFNYLETEVSIVELMNSLLPLEDREITKFLQRNFQKRGIKIYTETKLEEISIEDGNVKVRIIKGKDSEAIETDLILSATGRVPDTENLGLQELGIELDDEKFIKVNKKMQTHVSNIYAVGDVVNTPMLAHVAYKEAEIAIDAITGQEFDSLDYTHIPNAVYCEPEIASVGLVEEDIKTRGIEYKSSKYFYKANSKAVVNQKEEGLIKVFIEKASGKILGVHILGANATEIIHEFVVAKKNNLDLKTVSETVHAHPTLSEIAMDVSKNIIK